MYSKNFRRAYLERPRVVLSSDNESSSDSTGESRSGSSSQSSDSSSSTKLIDRRTFWSLTDFQIGESRPVSEVTRQSNDFLEPSDRSGGVVRAGCRMPPIRSSSANIQIGRSPSGHVVPLNIPKGYSLYDSENKLDRYIFEMHRLASCDSYIYFSTQVPFHLPHYRNSNSGWKKHFFFVRPVTGSFPFDTFWKHHQIGLFNSPVDITPYLQKKIDQLINLGPPGSELDKVLTYHNMLIVEGVEYDLNAVLNSIPLATNDEGPVKDSAPSKRRKLSNKGKGSSLGKEPDDNHLDDETTFHDIRFPPTNANKDLELVRSCALEPLRTGLSRRKVSSVKKTLAVYTKRVITMQDAMALACEDLERHLENMDLYETELTTEVDNSKKEIGEKSSQAKLAESKAKAQEDEIDTLRSTLACAHKDAVSSYKAL
ncbi:Uncharacterized protein Adt_46518 [Abeliophyllum distichum]|uniref:Uncharacterized protein n=1 Tax=Abeliophyllum distichum TaxID=126358 RepID=A0ABD1P1H6_9LAMI